MSHEACSLTDFRGSVRLFPLPNLVLFPHAIQPLHLFEPRYRQLMADALNDDRLIAMALLRPGWEEQYAQNPPIHTVVCVGRIFQEERLPDGRYDLLLHGVSRARVREEVSTSKLYRTARVDLLRDVAPGPASGESALRRQLGERLTGWFPEQSPALAQLRKLVAASLDLGALCDIFGFALPLDLDAKRQLLEEVWVERRARLLLAHLKARDPRPPAQKARCFPPLFSAN
jgi:Lon protease-like protein